MFGTKPEKGSMAGKMMFDKRKISVSVYVYAAWVIIAFFSFLYISLIFNDNLLTDEAFTMQLIQGTVPEIISGTIHDVHPPLYYLFAKLVLTVFGRGIPPQKVLTIIPMVLALCFGPLVVAKDYGERTGFWYTLFFACVPCTMEFALQIRMYSFAILFVTGTFLCSGRLRLKERVHTWLIYTLFILAACYTHYFALVSAGFLHILLGIRIYRDAFPQRNIMSTDNGTSTASKRKLMLTKIKPWLFSTLLIFVCYLPWAFILLRQTYLVSQSYWIPPITLKTVYGYFTWAFGLEAYPITTPVFLILMGIMIFAFLLFKQKGTGIWPDALLVPALTMGFGVAFSLLIRPIYRDQYIFPAMGIVFLFFAEGMELFHNTFASGAVIEGMEELGLPKDFPESDFSGKNTPIEGGFSDADLMPKPIEWVFSLLVLAFLLFCGAIQYKECFHQEYRSTLVPELEEYFSEHLNADDCVVYNYELFGFIYEYYFPNNDLIYIEDYDPDNDYQITYFLNTEHNPQFTYEQLVEWGYTMAYAGRMGVEQNDFDVYYMWKNE
ncbi:MAG: glycosyltransferase family 39 protein [Lachnospiraceae bacterium]|nr:glycosyltransferase family 39 protein [Lachnospiraceae bacterium]